MSWITHTPRRTTPLCNNGVSIVLDEDEDDLSSSSGAKSETSSNSSLSFGSVHVREYERILNEEHYNLPTALSLGWGYQDQQEISLEDYHTLRCRSTRTSNENHPKTSSSQNMPPTTNSQRFRILKDFGFSISEILSKEQERTARRMEVLQEEQSLR